MIAEVLRDAEERMLKGVDVLRKEYATIRAGRANPGILDKVMVEYYGAPTPINQLANISAPEPRLLVIQAWEKSVLPAIERAIMKSDLGLNPSSDGVVIRLIIPQLTAERRVELVKKLKKRRKKRVSQLVTYGEMSMIGLRNWRKITGHPKTRSRGPKKMFKR